MHLCCFLLPGDQWQLTATSREGGSERRGHFFFYRDVLQVGKVWTSYREREREREELAAPQQLVCEVETGDVTVGSLLPITSTHLLLHPATSCLGCMPRTQRPAAGPPLTRCPSRHLIILLLLINIHTQAVGMGTPLEPLLSVRSFSGIVCTRLTLYNMRSVYTGPQ